MIRKEASFFAMLAALALSGTLSLKAATFIVPTGDVAGLKAAINTANTNNEDDTIELAVQGDYSLATVDNVTVGANGLPGIASDGGHSLMVNGNGAFIRRSSAADTPFFRILYVGPAANVTLTALAIANGNLSTTGCDLSKIGGGVLNDGGRLTMERTLILSNSADLGGGIFSKGEYGNATLILKKSMVVRNSADIGGGITNDAAHGSACIHASTSMFTENRADGPDTGGGALFNEGYLGDATLDIENCTFDVNGAKQGGAIYNDAFQGHVSGVISNCTFGQNSANAFGGAVFNYEGAGGNLSLDVASCTFFWNSAPEGQALGNSGDPGSNGIMVRIRNTIFDAQTGVGNISANVGTITSLGYNLSDDDGSSFLNARGDQIKTDPMLQTGWRNNGGGTQTVALLPGSPAINSGDPNAPAQDQRYYLRNGIPDKGAFEYNGAVAPMNAVSRKTHRAAGNFDVDLPLTGTAGVECRTGGANGNYEVVLNFPTLINAGTASVSSGTGSVSNAVVNYEQVTIDLTGVTNSQQIVLTLLDVDDGPHSNAVMVPLRILLGDINGSGTVNASDVGDVKGQVGQTVSSLNFRTDVNANGTINTSDVGIVKSQVGTGISIPMENVASNPR